jgi:hypothetical protein
MCRTRRSATRRRRRPDPRGPRRWAPAARMPPFARAPVCPDPGARTRAPAPGCPRIRARRACRGLSGKCVTSANNWVSWRPDRCARPDPGGCRPPGRARPSRRDARAARRRRRELRPARRRRPRMTVRRLPWPKGSRRTGPARFDPGGSFFCFGPGDRFRPTRAAGRPAGRRGRCRAAPAQGRPARLPVAVAPDFQTQSSSPSPLVPVR